MKSIVHRAKHTGLQSVYYLQFEHFERSLVFYSADIVGPVK